MFKASALRIGDSGGDDPRCARFCGARRTRTFRNVAVKVGAQGKRLGRPSVDGVKAEQVFNSLAAGHGVHTTARICGVSTGTVRKFKADVH